jgi:hypothetical protein
VAGKQVWLGPARAGLTVTFWADTDVIHLLIAGARVKTVRSHLSVADLAVLAARGGRLAGPPPLPPPTTRRPLRSTGSSTLPGWSPSAGGPCWPRRSSPASRSASASTDYPAVLRPRQPPAARTRPNPLSHDQARRLRDARAAGPPPQLRTGQSPSSAGSWSWSPVRRSPSAASTPARPYLSMSPRRSWPSVAATAPALSAAPPTNPVTRIKAHRPRKPAHADTPEHRRVCCTDTSVCKPKCIADQSPVDSPRQLLTSVRDLTRQVRIAQRGTWFPLLVFGVITLAATPVVRYGPHHPGPCRSDQTGTGCTRSPRWWAGC